MQPLCTFVHFCDLPLPCVRGPRGETLSSRLVAMLGGGTGCGGARTNDGNATMATNPDRRAVHGRRVAEVLDCGLPARVGYPRQLQRQGEEGLQQAGQQRDSARFPAVRKGERSAGTILRSRILAELRWLSAKNRHKSNADRRRSNPPVPMIFPLLPQMKNEEPTARLATIPLGYARASQNALKH